MFELSRAGNNVPAEVQRWQYFLRKQNISEVGRIDASFGQKTEIGTKIFQMKTGLTAHGRADERTIRRAEEEEYVILDSAYYQDRAGVNWPPKPNDIRSPSNQWRNQKFKCFKFLQKPLSQRPDAESIVIKGSCDGTVTDWEEELIVDLVDDRLKFAVGYNGYIRCHKYAAGGIKALLDKWEDESLLHLVLNYAGSFVPRYKRNQAPSGNGGHSTRKSVDVSALSNHSFGSAFDISTSWNWLGDTPATCGRKGSVRELVNSANQLGFFWGGHYNSTKDGMHFELTEKL